MMLLDVIYVNFNSTKCLINSIESLYNIKEKNNLQIIVIDNSSKDDPYQLKNLFPKINLILNKENTGFGAAINQALKYCLSKYIIFLNPDSFVTDGFIETSIRFMDQNDHIGIMGPMILDEDGGVQGSARAFPTMMTSLFGRNSPITKIFPNNSITRANILTNQSNGRTPMEVDWVSGACMVIRREAMDAVEGFDERFFLYWEDTDLCCRIRDAGWKVVYYPKAKATHSVGKSSSTRPVFANYHFHKSCYRLYEKYAKWPFSILTPIAGIALMLRFLTAVLFNYLVGTLNRIQQIQKHRRIRGEQKKGIIRILRIISRMNIGGPSIHVKNLTENLNPGKFSTRLITGTVSPGEGDMGYLTNFKGNVKIFIPELQREISPYHDLKALLKVVKAIQRFQPDIVHSHTSKAGTISRLAVMICNLFNKKRILTVHTFHGNVLDGYFSKSKSFLFLFIERMMAKQTDKIVAISDSQKWELVNIYKIDQPQKISTIKLGFDLQPFKNTGQYSGGFRKRLGLSDDFILIGLVGRMAPIKNHKMFLDAGKRLLERNKNLRFKFILVGDGEERSFLERYVENIGVKEDVIFYGWEKEIPTIYADLDVLALTSINEGTPVSVIEAMAASVPVVTTGVGGIKDLLGKIIEKNVNNNGFHICERGILCPRGDSEIFASGLLHTIDNGYRTNTDRVRRAREYVVNHYSQDRLVKDVEKLYHELLRIYL